MSNKHLGLTALVVAMHNSHEVESSGMRYLSRLLSNCHASKNPETISLAVLRPAALSRRLVVEGHSRVVKCCPLHAVPPSVRLFWVFPTAAKRRPRCADVRRTPELAWQCSRPSPTGRTAYGKQR